MKPLSFIAVLLIAFSSSACNKSIIFRSVPHRFVETKKKDSLRIQINSSFDINTKNLLVLKIKETKSNEIKRDTNAVTYADIAYHFYGQVVIEKPNDFIAEEVYLYLDGIDGEKHASGRAVYFITYSLKAKESKNLYFNSKKYFEAKNIKLVNNDESYIFSGVIKTVKVGWWYRRGEGISLYFTQRDKSVAKTQKLIGFKGKWERTSKGYCQFVMKKASTVATASEISKEIKDTFSIAKIDERLLYLDVNKVFNLKNAEGLHFQQIQKRRQFIHFPFFSESKMNLGKINNPDYIKKILLGEIRGKEALFFESEKGKMYHFKKRKRSFIGRAKKYFSILDLKVK